MQVCLVTETRGVKRLKDKKTKTTRTRTRRVTTPFVEEEGEEGQWYMYVDSCCQGEPSSSSSFKTGVALALRDGSRPIKC